VKASDWQSWAVPSLTGTVVLDGELLRFFLLSADLGAIGDHPIP